MSQALITYDTSTIMAGSALALNVTTSAYFYYRIRELETELAEVKKHLATIVPTTDPNMKSQIIVIVDAINKLNAKVENLEKTATGIIMRKSDKDASPKRSYVRLTNTGQQSQNKNSLKKGENFQMSTARRSRQRIDITPAIATKLASSTSPTSATSVADSEESSTSSDSEMDESFENDIAAMM